MFADGSPILQKKKNMKGVLKKKKLKKKKDEGETDGDPWAIFPAWEPL